MNERIKELVGRAEAYAYEHEEHWHDGPDWQELFNKKFAELIIRECMDLLEDYTTDVHVGGIQYNVLSADETLQKHFGLE